MTKSKLERFAQMDTFSNVVQLPFTDVYGKDYKLKGKWKSDFFGNNHPLVLELGCGKGEYTVGLARRYPEKNFIGIDIKGARMWKGARAALNEELKNAAFVRTRIEFIQSVFDHDEVDEIWITFPDPQPKKRNKRLSSSRFLNSYKQFLKPDGIIHLKTDNKVLFEYTHALAIENKLPVIVASDNLYKHITEDPVLSIRTFYEQQFLDQGMNIHYLKFALTDSNQIREPVEYKE